MRKFTFTDQLCLNIDQAARTLANIYPECERADPSQGQKDNELSSDEKKVASGLMRINHAGEVCAQALYQGQSLTARLPNVREKMQQAADEEVEHLAWCKSRLDDLDSHTSFLNPVWYVASFTIGAVAGAVGDKWSLGFVAETERQVVTHLEKHMSQLPPQDKKSHAVLKQMQIDEDKHRHMAIDAGAAQFPKPIQVMMTFVSKFMTKTAYWI